MFRTAHIDTFVRDHLPPKETWPELFVEPPTPQYPDRLNCAVELLDQTISAGEGSRPAFISGGDTIRYCDVAERVNQIAHVLVDDFGLVPGNRVRADSFCEQRAVGRGLDGDRESRRSGRCDDATLEVARAPSLIKKAQVRFALCDYRLSTELETAVGESPPCEGIVLFDGQGRNPQEARASRLYQGPFF